MISVLGLVVVLFFGAAAVCFTACFGLTAWAGMRILWCAHDPQPSIALHARRRRHLLWALKALVLATVVFEVSRLFGLTPATSVGSIEIHLMWVGTFVTTIFVMWFWLDGKASRCVHSVLGIVAVFSLGGIVFTGMPMYIQLVWLVLFPPA